MKKKIAVAILIAVTLLLVCACAKRLSSNAQEVDAYIIDTDYHRPYMQPITTGKTVTIFRHPAKYYVKIGYEDLSLTVDDQVLYTQYHGHNGENIKCLLVSDKYDDGTIKRYLKLIENNP